jgi:hypothetical protein
MNHTGHLTTRSTATIGDSGSNRQRDGRHEGTLVDELNWDRPCDVELHFVGSPPTEESPRTVQEFLKRLTGTNRHGMKVAAFDTRLASTW